MKTVKHKERKAVICFASFAMHEKCQFNADTDQNFGNLGDWILLDHFSEEKVVMKFINFTAIIEW